MLSRRILNSQRTERKSMLLKIPFSASHLIFTVEKKRYIKNIQYTTREIGFRETFVLLMKVRKRERNGVVGKGGGTLNSI